MTDLPEEAIEAAAKALEQNAKDEGDDDPFVFDDFFQRRAYIALAAALPLLREQIAQEIEAAKLSPDKDSYRNIYLDVAARVARGTPDKGSNEK